MDDLTKQWVKERDAALETKSIEELIKFMEKWTQPGFYAKSIVKNFKKASEQVQIGTMCKMIMNCTNISKSTKKWAKNQLDKMGWSYEIY